MQNDAANDDENEKTFKLNVSQIKYSELAG